MKGTLHKTEQGWVVKWIDPLHGFGGAGWTPMEAELHPDSQKLEKSEPTGIKRTFKGRKRHDEFTAWEMVSLGEDGPIFLSCKKNKIYIIQMNQDHAFWTNFLYDAPMDVKSIFNMYFVSQAIGLEKTTYYDDEEKHLLMNEYNLHVSEQMRKLITL
jgi:hypothetical protein